MAVSADRRCEKACFGLRFRLYHALIWALSCSEMVHIGSRNGPFRRESSVTCESCFRVSSCKPEFCGKWRNSGHIYTFGRVRAADSEF